MIGSVAGRRPISRWSRSMRALLALAVTTLAASLLAAVPAWPAVYEGGYGAAPAYRFHDQKLNDRAGFGVNLATGNLLLSGTDIAITGTGIDLVLSRYYNSLSTVSGPLGYGWTLGVGRDIKVTTQANGDVEYQAPTFFKAVFVRQVDGSYRAPSGLRVRLERGADGVFTATYRPGRTKVRFGGQGGAMSSITDKNDNTISLAYDGSGRLASLTDTQGRVTTVTYDTAGRIDKITSPAGRIADYGYSAAGDLTSYLDPAGRLTQYGYDTAHQLTRITDPRGNATTIGYDTSRRVTRFVRVTNVSTGTGPTTQFAYATGDSRCESGLTSHRLTNPRGYPTTYCADSDSRIRKAIDARGNDQNASYDADGNVTELASGSAISRATFLEGGRIESATAPMGERQSWTYGDPAHQDFPTGHTDAQGATTTLGYRNNNLETITDHDGRRTTLDYNSNGTVKSSTTPKGAGLADPNPYKTTYNYDIKGNLVQVVHPSPLGSENLTRDALSRIATHTDGKGQRRTYTYDALDRVTRIEFRDAAGVVQTTVSYGYDANGNRTSRTVGTAVTSYTYDQLNRLTQETFPGSIVNRYTYDAAGNLATFADGGGTVSYAYDPTDNVSTITEPDGRQTTFGYNRQHSRTSTNYPNGITMTNVVDDSQKIKEIIAQRTGVAAVVHLTYDYSYRDANNVLKEGQLRRQSTDRVAGTTTDFSYDNAERLSQVHTYTTGTGATRDRWTYAYDPNSNRTAATRNGTQTSYTYNPANQLTAIDGYSMYYDGNGNPTGGALGQYQYNARNQTTHMGIVTGQPDVGSYGIYTYAGADQWELVNETVRDPAGEGRIGADYRNSALGITGVAPHTCALPPCAYNWFTRDDNGTLTTLRNGANRYYYVFDALGSVVALTDSAGNAAATYQYDPYGKDIGSTGTVPNPWRFTGALSEPGPYFPSDQALYKMGMRWYSPAIGRWTQQDPRNTPADPRNANRYLYAAGDPVNSVDPTGLHETSYLGGNQLMELAEGCVEGAAEGAVVGGIVGGIAGGPGGIAGGAAVGAAAGCEYGFGAEGLGEMYGEDVENVLDVVGDLNDLDDIGRALF